MKFSRAALPALFLLATVLCAPVHSQDTAFFDVSINYQDWNPDTEANTQKGPIGQKADYAYLEAEGGLHRSWGELYGFLDIENPTYGTHENGVNQSRRYAFKGSARYNITEALGLPVQLFLQIQDLNDADFHDQHCVLGVATSLAKDNFTIKPFVGIHQENKSNVGAQINGNTLGWTLTYNFSHWGESLSITNWHEIEWGRDRKYLVMADNGKLVIGSDTSQNGAVGLMWNINKRLTTGLSYRYLSNKLSSAAFQDAFVYTARVYF
jgi:hypothetical protein